VKKIWGYFSQAMGCLALILAAVALLIVGSCQWQDIRLKQAIRSSLPAQYQDGEFIFFNRCDGYSYIFKLSPAAAQRLRSNVNANETGVHDPALWGTEGAAGFRCLKSDHPYHNKPSSLKDHINLASTYYRQTSHRTYEYFIPSLGVIAGGNDPR
jgi:hypothetical protein